MTASQREASYGEHRKFRGIENFAINRRLRVARELLNDMVARDSERSYEVLELGCGFWGRNLSQLSKEFTKMSFIGVDLSVSEGVRGIRLVEADIANWEPMQEYDVVLSLAVVEHLLEPQDHFNLIAACLKKGGYAGLTTPRPQAHPVLELMSLLGVFDRPEIKDHKLYLTETGISQMAERSDLFVERYQPFSLGMNQWTLLRKN